MFFFFISFLSHFVFLSHVCEMTAERLVPASKQLYVLLSPTWFLCQSVCPSASHRCFASLYLILLSWSFPPVPLLCRSNDWLPVEWREAGLEQVGGGHMWVRGSRCMVIFLVISLVFLKWQTKLKHSFHCNAIITFTHLDRISFLVF